MKKLALFDFDGTLTSKDSLLAFARFTHGSSMFFIGLLWLSPALLLYSFKIIPNWRMKELFIKYFWMGRSKEQMLNDGAQFCEEILPGILRENGVDTVKKYLQDGWEVAIVSASAEYWLKAYFSSYNLHLICTKLALSNGCLTGEIDGKNCYGAEKVVRVQEVFDLDEFKEIHVFGDSRGDREMIELSTKSFFKPFRN